MKAKEMKQSQARSLKTAWKKSTSELPLKRWVREHTKDNKDAELAIKCQDWLFNKKVNCSTPQKHIGRTNRTEKKKS